MAHRVAFAILLASQGPSRSARNNRLPRARAPFSQTPASGTAFRLAGLRRHYRLDSLDDDPQA